MTDKTSGPGAGTAGARDDDDGGVKSRHNNQNYHTSQKRTTADWDDAAGRRAGGRDVEITVFRSANGALSKRINLTDTGEINADGSACKMVAGTARRVQLDGIDSLASLMERMRSDEALALGRLRGDLPDEVQVTVAKNLKGAAVSGTIARTTEFLHFEPDAPAYMLCDHDRKGQPPEVTRELKQRGGFWQAVEAAVPGLAAAALVVRSSTSAGLYHRKTNEWLTRGAGWHVYVAVADGGDIERTLRTLHDRLWLVGLGYFVVGAAGQLLERSIIDVAVYGPERLVFEGAPVLVPPVAQHRKRRQPRVYGGDFVDTVLVIPDLNADEKAQVDALKAAAKDRLKPKAAEVREAWAEKFAAQHGMSKEEAVKIMADAADRHTLHVQFELEFDELGRCTVGDVLNNPDDYVGQSLADPLEGVAYGRGKAKVFRQHDGGLMINSFAHGGIKYKLIRHPSVIEVVPGQLARTVDEAQGALLKAEVPIFVRSGVLVEPITSERDAAHGRKVDVTALLPVDERRLSYLLNKHAAVFRRFDHRRQKLVEIDPPPKVAATLCSLRQWKIREVVGVIGAPTMRPDGSVLCGVGYDAQTGLWCDSDIDLPTIPERPSLREAEAALQLYEELLTEFPFVSETDRAVALTAIQTGVLRGAFDLAPIILGDLVRRVLTCRLDAKVERPEQREFKLDPIEQVLRDRGRYIAAAITIARAWRAAGQPVADTVAPLGGYNGWSKAVRYPLLWLGVPDPVACMEEARAADPERAATAELIACWQQAIGVGKAVRVRNIIAVANEPNRQGGEPLRLLLIEHAGNAKGDGIDPKRLGMWLQAQAGRVYGALRIACIRRKGRVNDYVLESV